MITFTDHFRESPMSIKWRVDFLPDEVFRMCYPENFSAASGPRRHFLMHCRKDLSFDWSFGRDRAEAVGSDPIGSIRLKLWADEKERALRWRLRFVNNSGVLLEKVSAFNCLNLANAPLFRDLSLERTRVLNQHGDWGALRTVSRSLGDDTVKQYYPARGGIDLSNHTQESKTTGWGIAETLLCGDRVVVESADGKWQLESAVEGPLAYFFTNWEPAGAGCVHAAPLFGDVASGQEATVQGQIKFIEK